MKNIERRNDSTSYGINSLSTQGTDNLSNGLASNEDLNMSKGMVVSIE
jgi:hypothetical protein